MVRVNEYKIRLKSEIQFTDLNHQFPYKTSLFLARLYRITICDEKSHLIYSRVFYILQGRDFIPLICRKWRTVRHKHVYFYYKRVSTFIKSVTASPFSEPENSRHFYGGFMFKIKFSLPNETQFLLYSSLYIYGASLTIYKVKLSFFYCVIEVYTP